MGKVDTEQVSGRKLHYTKVYMNYGTYMYN